MLTLIAQHQSRSAVRAKRLETLLSWVPNERHFAVALRAKFGNCFGFVLCVVEYVEQHLMFLLGLRQSVNPCSAEVIAFTLGADPLPDPFVPFLVTVSAISDHRDKLLKSALILNEIPTICPEIIIRIVTIWT